MRRLSFVVIDKLVDAPFVPWVALGGGMLTSWLSGLWVWFRTLGPVETFFLMWVGIFLWIGLMISVVFLGVILRRLTTWGLNKDIEWLSDNVEAPTISKWWQEAHQHLKDLDRVYNEYSKWKSEIVYPQLRARFGANFANEYLSIGDLEEWWNDSEIKLVEKHQAIKVRPIIRRDMKFLRHFVSETNRALLLPFSYRPMQ